MNYKDQVSNEAIEEKFKIKVGIISLSAAIEDRDNYFRGVGFKTCRSILLPIIEEKDLEITSLKTSGKFWLQEHDKLVDINNHILEEKQKDAIGFAEWIEESGFKKLSKDGAYKGRWTRGMLTKGGFYTTQELYELYLKEK